MQSRQQSNSCGKQLMTIRMTIWHFRTIETHQQKQCTRRLPNGCSQDEPEHCYRCYQCYFRLSQQHNGSVERRSKHGSTIAQARSWENSHQEMLFALRSQHMEVDPGKCLKPSGILSYIIENEDPSYMSQMSTTMMLAGTLNNKNLPKHVQTTRMHN